MTLNLIPALKGHGRRRAIDKLAELRDENRRLLDRQLAADDFFACLMQDRTDLQQALEQEKERREEAEIDAVYLQSEYDDLLDEVEQLRAELAAYKAREANANRVDVPCGVRDTTDPEDQATVPVPIVVHTLQQAHCIGPVRDPGRIR